METVSKCSVPRKIYSLAFACVGIILLCIACQYYYVRSEATLYKTLIYDFVPSQQLRIEFKPRRTNIYAIFMSWPVSKVDIPTGKQVKCSIKWNKQQVVTDERRLALYGLPYDQVQLATFQGIKGQVYSIDLSIDPSSAISVNKVAHVMLSLDTIRSYQLYRNSARIEVTGLIMLIVLITLGIMLLKIKS